MPRPSGAGGRKAWLARPMQEFSKQELEPHYRKCESCWENDEWCALTPEDRVWRCAACVGED